MKIVQFTIPVAKEHSIIVQEDKLPHFYNHLHRHNETQITWIMKGEGSLIAGSSMQRFKPGDIYIIGANQPHILKSDPDYFEKRRKTEVHALTIFVDPAGSFANLLELPEMKSVKKFLEATSVGLQVPELHQRTISEKMLQVKEAKNGFRLSCFINLLQMLTAIKKYKILSNTHTEYSISESEGLRMNDIYQYTMTHYTENISLKQIAGVAHLTPQAFCRYFKKHTLKTYITFLNEVRINEACKKIVAEDFDSLASVAYQTGFSNAVTFNRVFKKITGQPPKQFLNEYLQKVD
jgi:YesN/AraC family two-component response regulator